MATFDLVTLVEAPSLVSVTQPVVQPTQGVPVISKNRMLVMTGKPPLLVP